jgi:predicted nucleic acid-binding protein
MTNGASQSPSVYLDSNSFIYFIEGEHVVANRLRPLFELLRSQPGIGATSELTLAEVLPKARPDTRRTYLNLIVWSRFLHLEPVTREILIDTADYRRTTARTHHDGRTIMPKLPDAIHIVRAMQIRRRAVLSADGSLKVPMGMAIFQPSEAGISQLIRQLA